MGAAGYFFGTAPGMNEYRSLPLGMFKAASAETSAGGALLSAARTEAASGTIIAVRRW